MPVGMVDVQIEGLRDLQSALRKLEPGSQKALQRHLKDVAMKVAEVVRGKVPRRTGKAASTVRGSATASSASVLAGGAKAPYFPWLDFGGSVGRGHERGYWQGAVQRDWRGKPSGDGRYIYPTIHDEADDIRDKAQDALTDALREAGFH